MENWKFVEIIAILKDYNILLDQIAVLLITSAGILAFKFSRVEKRMASRILSAISLFSGIACLVIGFFFRSKLIDIIIKLGLKEGASSITDPSLKHRTIAQLCILAIGAIFLGIAALLTPRKENDIDN